MISFEDFKKNREELNKLAKEIAMSYKSGDKERAGRLKVVFNDKKDKFRSQMKEITKKNDLEILSRCIDKDDLEDGAWYSCDNDGKLVARFSNDAQWDEEKQMFLAPGQQQFGSDGWLDYFDPDSSFAGFPPMSKVNNKL